MCGQKRRRQKGQQGPDGSFHQPAQRKVFQQGTVFRKDIFGFVVGQQAERSFCGQRRDPAQNPEEDGVQGCFERNFYNSKVYLVFL